VSARLPSRERYGTDKWATAAGTQHYPLKPSKQGRNYWRYSGGRGWRIPQPSSWALLPIAQCSSAAPGDELSAVLASEEVGLLGSNVDDDLKATEKHAL
jgi:hypothetical protein